MERKGGREGGGRKKRKEGMHAREEGRQRRKNGRVEKGRRKEGMKDDCDCGGGGVVAAMVDDCGCDGGLMVVVAAMVAAIDDSGCDGGGDDSDGNGGDGG
jgi:hypothetical protein